MNRRYAMERTHTLWITRVLLALGILLVLTIILVPMPVCGTGPATALQNGGTPLSLLPQAFDLIASRGDEPYDIAISPDGRTAYVPARNTDNLFVIDLSTFQVMHIIDLYPQAQHPLGPAPNRVALTPDGSRLLITNDNDESVTLVDAAGLEPIATLPLGGPPQDVAVAPDGAFAYVLVNGPNIIEVIDPDLATRIGSIPGVPEACGSAALAFGPTGEKAYLIMSSGHLLEIDTARHSVSQVTPLANGAEAGFDLILNRAGTLAYTTSLENDAILVIDLTSRQVRSRFAVENAESLALSADETRLFVGTFGWAGEALGNLLELDAVSGELLAHTSYRHPASYGRCCSDIQRLAMAADGSRLYVPTVDGDGVLVVDPDTLEAEGMIPTQALARFFPVRAALSPNGDRLYVPGNAREPLTVRIVDTATRQVVGELRDTRSGACVSGSSGVCLAPDGGTLYALSSNCCEILSFDVTSAVLQAHNGIPSQQTLTHLTIIPDGSALQVLGMDGWVRTLNAATLQVTQSISTAIESAWTIKLSPDGSRGYVSGAYGYAVLDLASGVLLDRHLYCQEYESFCHVHGRALGVTPDGAAFAVGEFFDLHVYDAASLQEAEEVDLFTWNRGRTLIRDIAFAPDGSAGYAAMWDEKAVLAFDPKTWQVTAQIDTGRAPYHGVCPTWLQVSPDGGTVYATCEESDNVIVIDTASESVVGSIRVGQPYGCGVPLALRNAKGPTLISGVVRDAMGEPVPNIIVGAGPYQQIMDCQPGSYWAETGTDGAYRLGLPPGSYCVFVNSHGQAGGYASVIYPDITSWSQRAGATAVTVAQGETATDIDLALPPVHSVVGRLVDGVGQGVLEAGGWIGDEAQDIEFGCAIGFGSSDVDGRFAVNVPTGRYEMGFCQSDTCHTVMRDYDIAGDLDLGDVLFADAE